MQKVRVCVPSLNFRELPTDNLTNSVVLVIAVGKQKFDLFLNTARTKVNEFEQLQTQRQATGMQPAGITSTLGGIFNDAKAVATGRRDGSQGPGGQGQGQGLAALGAGVGSALSGLSGLFGGRGAGQAEQGGQGGAGSSWGSNAQPRSMGGGGGAFNSRPGAGGQTSQQYQNAGRRWQPTDIYGESRPNALFSSQVDLESS
jgi:hypothetical protein